MDLYEQYGNELHKLNKACSDMGLKATICKDAYPMVIILEPEEPDEEQQSFIDAEDRVNKDAKVEFIYEDEPLISVSGNLLADVKTLNKLKNHARNLHYIFLQIWFKQEKGQGESR